jgi:hypothetical protein
MVAVRKIVRAALHPRTVVALLFPPRWQVAGACITARQHVRAAPEVASVAGNIAKTSLVFVRWTARAPRRLSGVCAMHGRACVEPSSKQAESRAKAFVPKHPETIIRAALATQVHPVCAGKSLEWRNPSPVQGNGSKGQHPHWVAFPICDIYSHGWALEAQCKRSVCTGTIQDRAAKTAASEVHKQA